MKIAFTICSNNYLSQAKTLGDSLAKYAPDYKFIIGLCDKRNELVDYSFFHPYEIVEADQLNIPNLDWMILNYNIIELNTSIKPFFFEHFLNLHADCEIAIYFDPDIKVFNNLSVIEKEIENKSALLTPHILSPIPDDGKTPKDNTFLNYGIYNLGFVAIRPCEEAHKLLQWWGKWLSNYSIDHVADGLFVDQLPMNHAPVFFNKVCVSRTKGYNVAYWNFHERMISKNNENYMINGCENLIFFHFSSFKPLKPLKISEYQNRYSLYESEVLTELYSDYSEDLINNKYFELKEIPCYYVDLRKIHLQKLEIENKKNNSLHKRILRKIFK